jgi:hypothetical protein
VHAIRRTAHTRALVSPDQHHHQTLVTCTHRPSVNQHTRTKPLVSSPPPSAKHMCQHSLLHSLTQAQLANKEAEYTHLAQEVHQYSAHHSIQELETLRTQVRRGADRGEDKGGGGEGVGSEMHTKHVGGMS